MKLLWLDMEMTGLDVSKEMPIEVACVVTDFEFTTLTHYHAIIFQEQKYLDAMDDWNTKHHGSSGLTAQIPHGKKMIDVENELCELARAHFGDEKIILAGNSIGQDRLFIDKYMPRFSAMLHYRMMDVTAWKVIYNGRLNIKFPKKTVSPRPRRYPREHR